MNVKMDGKNDYSTFKNYENFLETFLELEENDSPLSAIFRSLN